MGADPFKFFAPLSFFEKASGPRGMRRRIAGIISTDILDKQGEIVVQKGLNFKPFLESGWFNDNHSKDTDSPLGYPTGVRRFQKGELLPDGQTADANGTWAEGWMVDTPRANRIWDLGRALAKAGNERRLGFSIEGDVVRRTGPNRKTVAEAIVKHTAITNCPIGFGTRLECLAKSMVAIEEGDEEAAQQAIKAMTATTGNAAPAGEHPSTQGSTTGEGAGRILSPQSLESDEKDLAAQQDERISKSEALALILTRFPGADHVFAERAYCTLETLAEHGRL
jgi:hypothetical protein